MRVAYLRRDGGMSVFEVVFAAFVMFVVLTGVLGLVATSTSMGIDARQRNLISNTISSRLEYVRSLPFEQVGIAGPGSTGVLPPTETFTVNGMTVTVAYQVRDGVGGTKQVRITATVAIPNKSPVTTTAYSTVRDRNQAFTTPFADNLGPKIEWADSTPPDGAVVYENLVWSPSGVLDLRVTAEPQTEEQKLVRMEMYLVGASTQVIYLKDGVSVGSDSARWEWSPDGLASVSESFRWHTQQVHTDADGDVVASVSDGWQTVRCRVWDSEGNSKSVDRRFYVNNYPPGAAGVPTVTVSSDALSQAMWAAGSGASMYDVVLYRQMPTGMGSYTDSGSWETSPTVTVPALTTNLSTYRFSRYVMTVLARSARMDAASASLSEPFVSRPLIAGTAVVTGLKIPSASASMTVSPPTFPCAGTTAYAFQYRNGTTGAWTSLGTSVTVGSAPVQYASPAKALVKSGVAYLPLYYRCVVTFTPDGYLGGTPTTVITDVIGPTGNVAGPPTVLTHAEW